MRRLQALFHWNLIYVLGSLVALAMILRASLFWGPLNLVVLAVFLSLSACSLALIPIIPHRPFWTGFGIFALLYFGLYVLATDGGWREHLPTEKLFRAIVISRYGSRPDFKTSRVHGLTEQQWDRSVNDAALGGHAIAAMAFGLLGGTSMLSLSKMREARRWNRVARPERRLEDFLHSPLKIHPPANSK